VVVDLSMTLAAQLQPCRCFVGLRAPAFLVVDVRSWLVAEGAEGRFLQKDAPQFGVFPVLCRLLGAYPSEPQALLFLRQEEVYVTRGS